MKLTRIHILIGSVFGLGVIGFVVWLLIRPTLPPSDTPIVLGGGSIYGETSSRDSDGWKAQGNGSETSSLHGNHQGKNPYGIDLLTFTNFDPAPPGTIPGYQITGTGGWAILIRNVLPSGSPNLTTAVKACSDANCSAEHPPCPTTSFQDNPVTFLVRQGAQIQTTLGGPSGSNAVQYVLFHDPTDGCGISGCDKIYDLTVKTCNGGNLGPFTCNNYTNPQKCQVTIGIGTP